MSTPAPLIGVVSDQKIVAENGRPFMGMYASYLDCVAAAGGLPVLIPLGLPSDLLRGIVERLDGLVLTGGGDVDPRCYGETDAAGLAQDIKPIRDETELQVSRWAAGEDKPLLGICRGHQVVNVALGGTLYTDIFTQIRTALAHDLDDQPLNHYVHQVVIEPDSRLARIVGTTRIAANSRHHQAVQTVGAGLAVTARAPDGIIEATEKPDARFLVTVQWHPENMCGEDPTTDALFAALVEAAAQYQQERQRVAERQPV